MTWKRMLLKDVCEVFSDGDWIESKDQSIEGIRLVQTGNIGFGFFKDKEDKSRFISNETFQRLKCTEIFAGDLLVSRLPDPVGKSCIIPEINSRMITGVDCTILRPKDFLNSNFLCYYQMSQNYLKDVNKGISGSTRQRISRKNLGLIEIPFPPLPEQQRIVAILDDAFSKIEKAKANTEQNLKNAKELFESYLQGVFESKGDDWEEKTLKEVCAKITDGTHQTPKYFDEGVIFLSSRNVTSGKIDWDNIKYIDEKQHLEMHKRVAPRVGDILLAKNGTTGVAAMVDRDLVFDIYVSLAHIRVLDEVTPDFMLYFINSPIAKKQFNKRLKGSGVPNLHLEEIREVEISFPKSKKEQNKIVEKLNNFSNETKKLEVIYNQKIKDLEELKKSVLHKAFNGEL